MLVGKLFYMRSGLLSLAGFGYLLLAVEIAAAYLTLWSDSVQVPFNPSVYEWWEFCHVLKH